MFKCSLIMDIANVSRCKNTNYRDEVIKTPMRTANQFRYYFIWFNLILLGSSLPPQFIVGFPWAYPKQQLPREQSMADQTHLLRITIPQTRRSWHSSNWKMSKIQETTLDCPRAVANARNLEARFRDKGRRCVQFGHCNAGNHIQGDAILHGESYPWR